MHYQKKINWEEQWALHSPSFEKGKAHISLQAGDRFPLSPGPGFGDGSHPTTQLMLALLPQYVPGQIVFDIGCGSGILSIAAAKQDASKVYACDIDPRAEAHTRENASLCRVKVQFDVPIAFSQKPLVLMNMIGSEQKKAWSNHKTPFHRLITSGVLLSEKDSYLNFAKENNWHLESIKESKGWLALVFKENQ